MFSNCTCRIAFAALTFYWLCSKYNQGYASASTQEDSSGDTKDAMEALEPLSTIKRGGTQALKKSIELDSEGQPYGSMREFIKANIKKYAKDLNPITSWERQPHYERRRLFEHLYISTLCTFVAIAMSNASPFF